jgi:hypothetical protein
MTRDIIHMRNHANDQSTKILPTTISGIVDWCYFPSGKPDITILVIQITGPQHALKLRAKLQHRSATRE